MTPSDYIDKAIHAINTDQPNLAMLYMRRGIVESNRVRAQRRMNTVTGQLGLFVEALSEFGNSLVKQVTPMFQAFAEVFTRLEEGFQSDYAEVSE